jgi:calcineurin-like phosphoesterase family protein
MRGFVTPDGEADTEAHDAAILASLIRLVKPGDDLYFLGDLTLRTPAEVWPLVDKIPGRKICVTGNHDAPHPMHANGWKHQREWQEHFDAVVSGTTVRIAGEKVAVSHLPYLGGGDHTAVERYGLWRPHDDGGFLLCGHVHSLWKQKGRMINAGVDVWGMKPVREHEIELMIKASREAEK